MHIKLILYAFDVIFATKLLLIFVINVIFDMLYFLNFTLVVMLMNFSFAKVISQHIFHLFKHYGDLRVYFCLGSLLVA